MSNSILKLATRGSDLALTQTRHIKHLLSQKDIAATENIITTRGDKDLRPLVQLSGDGFFTKELERSLMKSESALAVHSAKDLPSMVHEDLPWTAVSEREDTVDLLIVRKNKLLSRDPIMLAPGTRVGTSSPRRKAQLSKLQQSINTVELRGNVPTRIAKVTSGELDAIVLAKAGISRLGLLNQVFSDDVEALPLDWVTAPCQGIIAVQGQPQSLSAMQAIANPELDELAKAEKSLLALMGGGCHLALGAQLKKSGSALDLKVFWGHEGGHFDFAEKGTDLTSLLRSFLSNLLGVNPTSSAPKVILTQPIQHTLKPAIMAAQAGLNPIAWPLLEAVPSWKQSELEDILTELPRFGAVAFSSQFAVQLFMTEMSSHLDIAKHLAGLKVFTVGSSTSKKLMEFGVHNIESGDDSHSGALANLIESTRLRGDILIPGQNGSLLKKKLGARSGAKLFAMYKMKAYKGPLAKMETDVIKRANVVLTSPSAAREFVLRSRSRSDWQDVKVWSFGPSTSKELDFLGVKHSKNPKSGSWESIIDAIRR